MIMFQKPMLKLAAISSLLVLTLLSAINLAANESFFTSAERSRIESLGPWPIDMPTDAGNQYSGQRWAENLGAKLFVDTDLSANGEISCASCHLQAHGFSDNRTIAMGAEEHVRNTQGLLNAGLQRWFGWDGGADSLWAAALRPLLSEIEMAGDVESIAKTLRNKADVMYSLKSAGIPSTGESLSDEALVVVAAKMLGAYTRTLVSGETPFDRYRQALSSGDTKAQQAYPAAARRGLKIFIGEANCSVCHVGPNFSNGEFHDIGRSFFSDVGKVDPGRYTGIKRVQNDPYNLNGAYNGLPTADHGRKTRTVTISQNNFGQWKTPSLRNLTDTAPYMHDGSLQTLRDVVDAYADIDPSRLHSNGESILKPLELTDDERNDLVVFLKSLSQDP